MGSSVGICKAKSKRQFKDGAEAALRHDSRLIIEECVDGRELETGVLGNAGVEVSAVGEILPEAEFYDYDSKYRSAGTKLIIPADMPEGKAAEIKSLAARAYKALNCKGFARVDFFMDRKTGRILLNEINTIPGFTKFSMFPLLWRQEGVSYRNLVERIIGLGYERHNAENNR
jgi:D-alanine-D-alanine ligase